jgi:peptide/nickel transport system permease protein
MRQHGPRVVIVAILIAIHAAVLLAGFFAPYDPDEQHRLYSFAPPSRVHLLDSHGAFHMRPFVYRSSPVANSFNVYREDMSATHPIRFFVAGAPYAILGVVRTRLHLFGTDGEQPMFLAGTDEYGRDEFSRVLFGGRISLFAGLTATGISLLIGLSLGGIAGYYGAWVDEFIMRASEIFMTVPWLYLLLSVRAVLPLHLSGARVFFLLSGVLGVVGWARPARLIRGVVLSAKQRDYVLAARGLGASDLYILRRHVLPYASSVAATQAALYIPQYVLAEITLSFFGLGVGEPTASWGNMLAELQQPFVLETCWWLFAPAAALAIVLFGYQQLLSRNGIASQQL